jgi:sulfoxide reductase heme-binding subunit YedZ
MVRRMGPKNWQLLHRLIYFATAAGVIHYYWLVKSDVRQPLMYGAILTLLMIYRVQLWTARKHTAKPQPAPVGASR